jgi:DNA polymerase III delta prime subunit
MPKLAMQFMKRVCSILTSENVEFDKAVIAEIITKHFPDWRRVLNELQRYSATGKIDSGILVNISDESFKKLISYLKNKQFTEMRKWVGENSDMDSSELFRKLYDNASDAIDKQSIPQLVLHLAKYQYQASFVADQEINLAACLTEILADCEFK